MADAHAKHHDYHLVDPSHWPIIGSVAAFLLAVGLISWMHKLYSAAPLVFAAGALGELSQVWGEISQAAGAAERLTELLLVEPAIMAPARPVPLPVPPRGEVAFASVRFAYPTRPDAYVLDGVSFRVSPGEKVAIVGPSGAGKSTIFHLLLRFYDPDSGTITFDGVRLADVDPTELRRRIALVPQDVAVFGSSIADNIRFGRPDASEAEIRRAAEQAFADEFIRRFLLHTVPTSFKRIRHAGFLASRTKKNDLARCRDLLGVPAPTPEPEQTSPQEALLDLTGVDLGACPAKLLLPARDRLLNETFIDGVVIDLRECGVPVDHLAEENHELHEIGVRLLPERLLAAAVQIVQQAGDGVGERVRFEVVVERVVAVRRVESDLDVVLFAPMPPEDFLDLPAEVALHFQDEAADFVLGIPRPPGEELLDVRIHAARGLPGADGAENHHPGVQAAARDREPRRLRDAHRFGRMMLLAEDEK